MDNYVIHSTQLQYFFPNKNFQMLTLSDYSDIFILCQLACDREQWASIFKLSEKYYLLSVLKFSSGTDNILKMLFMRYLYYKVLRLSVCLCAHTGRNI